MPFPESPRIVFERNPLAQVICQLRFPTILKVAAQEPAEFQESIRQEYPSYRKDQGPGTAIPEELNKLLSSFGMSAPQLSVAHTFQSADERKVTGLTPDFVAVTDNHYQDWNEFSADIDRAKAAVERVYQPSYYTRVGLRYVNVIDREKLGVSDVPWPQLIQPQLLGMLGTTEIGDEVMQIKTDTLIEIPEVDDAYLRLKHGLETKDERELYRFDADFFVAERRGPADVQPILGRFNVITGNFFRWAITAALRQALRPVEAPGRTRRAGGARR
jgi:uncharacterized protein (TIGR04255 family)